MAFLVTMPISIRDADPHRRGQLLAGQQQRCDGAADRERQREQDGDRLQEGSEQQHQHRIDTIISPAVIAVAKPSDSSLRLSASPDGETFDALRQALHDRQLVDQLVRASERGPFT